MKIIIRMRSSLLIFLLSWTRRQAIAKLLSQINAWKTWLTTNTFSSSGNIGAIRKPWETSIITMICWIMYLYSNVHLHFKRIQWWADTGLAIHWIKSYQPSAKGCLFQDYKKNAPALRVFTLKDLSGAFAVLSIGCALSFIVFLVEKIHYYGMMLRRSVLLMNSGI